MKLVSLVVALSLLAFPVVGAKDDLTCRLAVALKGTRAERTRRWWNLFRNVDTGFISELPARLPQAPLAFAIFLDDSAHETRSSSQEIPNCLFSFRPNQLEIEADEEQAPQVLRLLVHALVRYSTNPHSPAVEENAARLEAYSKAPLALFSAKTAAPLTAENEFAQGKLVLLKRLDFDQDNRNVHAELSVSRMEGGRIRFLATSSVDQSTLDGQAANADLNRRFRSLGQEPAQETNLRWNLSVENATAYPDQLGNWLTSAAVHNDSPIRYQLVSRLEVEAKRVAVRRWWATHVYHPLGGSHGTALLKTLHHQIQDAPYPVDVESLTALARLIGAWPGLVNEKAEIVRKFEAAYRTAIGGERILISMHHLARFSVNSRVELTLDADWTDRQRFYATVAADGSLVLTYAPPNSVHVRAVPLAGASVSQVYLESLLNSLRASVK